MVFWGVAVALAAAVGALVALAMVRSTTGAPDAARDLAVYRDQLREIEKDLARGTVTEDEAARLRTEIGRRVLAADKALAATPEPRSAGGSALIAAGTGAVIVAAAVGLYAWLGAPGYPDLPLELRIAEAEDARANRPGQAEAEASLPPVPAPVDVDPQFLTLMQNLRGAVAERPNELRGHELLAHNEALLGRFAQAATAQRNVIRLKAERTTAEDHARLADLMVLAAGGYVSPEAEEVLNTALNLDPQQGTARYYAGLMFAQSGRPDLAFRIWAELLEDSPENAPWVQPIRGQIASLAELAGVRYTLPEPDRGPSAADIAAAQDMAPEDRAAMIRAMVDGLAERLAVDGGPPQDWARLIRALTVLGQTENAEIIAAEARQTFAGNPDALALIDAALP